jgi:hypothetical protein
VDLTSLVTELQLRGFDQDKVDNALRCLVHVFAVQDHTSEEKGGILTDDIHSSYPIEVVQAATELFLEKAKVGGQQVYRVKWGCEEAARVMLGQLWDHASIRWNEYVSSMDDRYLGFFMPSKAENQRVVTTWKLRNDLKWFSIAIPRHGWNVLRIIDDLTAIAWKLDLAFGFRTYGAEGVQGERVLLHDEAYDTLLERAVFPADEIRRSINLWRFFSEYNLEATNFEELINECELTREEVVTQVEKFFAKNLTSHYNEEQYPPYFVNDKAKKEYQEEVRGLLSPMDLWLSRADSPPKGLVPIMEPEGNTIRVNGGDVPGVAQLANVP